MKKYDLYCSLFWLLMAVFVCVAALKFGIGNVRYPGPGFFPLLVGLLLLSLSLGMIILSIKDRSKDATFEDWPSFGLRVPLTLSVLFVYAISIEFLGYILSLFLLLVYLFKFPASRRWWVSIVSATTVAGLTYYCFGVLLKSQFPKGVFGIG